MKYKNTLNKSTVIWKKTNSFYHIKTACNSFSEIALSREKN